MNGAPERLGVVRRKTSNNKCTLDNDGVSENNGNWKCNVSANAVTMRWWNVYIPTHRKSAMNGAPERLRVVRRKTSNNKCTLDNDGVAENNGNWKCNVSANAVTMRWRDVYIHTHRKSAMNGAPERLRVVRRKTSNNKCTLDNDGVAENNGNWKCNVSANAVTMR